MSGCVFCKIAAGEIPATIVKQGTGMLAFGVARRRRQQ